MSTPKTVAERRATWEDRHNLVRVEVRVPAENAQEIRDIAARMRADKKSQEKG